MCADYASCFNIPGSYLCICDPGFTGDGFYNCSDFNECDLARDNCDINAECENLFGSFSCRCNHGYNGSGIECGR